MGAGISGKFRNTYGANEHSLPTKYKPNSKLSRTNSKGNVITERYYDSKGRAYKDIDYTNHGNPKTHPNVPHTHRWDWSDPNSPKRGD